MEVLLRTNHVEDEIKLVAVVAAREQGLAHQHLGKDATNSPDINSLGISSASRTHPQGGGERECTFVYILKESMISGARYHRVATYS